jgi:hypothetical protein
MNQLDIKAKLKAASAMLAALKVIAEKADGMSGWGLVIEDTAKRAIAQAEAAGIKEK